MSLVEEAFSEAFPEKAPSYNLKLRYSGRFSGYNANVRYTGSSMVFSLSKLWKEVSPEIKKGLIQSLAFKALGKKGSTIYTDMYNTFLKKVSTTAPRTGSEPELVALFQKINDRYFDGMMEMPNLVFGRHSVRKLGSYDYGTDTVTISSSLRGREDLCGYVLYHELLHKKFKFSSKNNRSYHHTREFKEHERRYDNAQRLEKELGSIAKKHRLFRFF